MWLPKDERRTLAFLYRSSPTGIGSYSFEELSKGLKLPTQTVEQIIISLRTWRLIGFDLSLDGKLRIDLTSNGRELGQKYNSWWSCSNLWYAEHIKNHWIWLIVSFLGGVISTLLINWLSIYLQRTQGVK